MSLSKMIAVVDRIALTGVTAALLAGLPLAALIIAAQAVPVA